MRIPSKPAVAALAILVVGAFSIGSGTPRAGASPLAAVAPAAPAARAGCVRAAGCVVVDDCECAYLADAARGSHP